MHVLPRTLPSSSVLAEVASRFPGADPSAIRASIALLRVANDVSSVLEADFAKFRLSRGGFTVLMLLRRGSQGLSPAELAEAANVTRPTMTGLVRTLERAGLLERRHHPNDHRSAVLTLTAKAKSLLDRLLPEHFRAQATLMAGLSEAERTELVRLLHQIRPQVHLGAAP